MDIKKTDKERVKVNWQAIWQKLEFVFWVSVGTLGLMFLAALAAVMFNDWIKCQTTAFLCLGSRWEVVKFIVLGALAGVLVLFIVVAAYKKAAQIENNRMKKMKEDLRKVEDICRVVWEILVAGFLVSVGGFGLILFILLITVIFDECIECWARIILDQMTKLEAIELIGLGIAGILTFFGAIAINRRAVAQVRNNELVEKGHIQERFKTAVEHLGNGGDMARIASFYEFSYLARDNKDLRRNIFDILCAHLRQTTADKAYQEKMGFNAVQKDIEDEKVSGISTIELADKERVDKILKDMRPTEEVQSLLDILFQSKDGQEELIFVGFLSNLQRIFLIGASLHKANLHKADLRRADLRFADLRGADLRDADLEGADLRDADLEGADLRDADLRGVDLEDADLQGADLRDVSLYDWTFDIAESLGITLHLLKANFDRTNLHGADLRGVDFRTVKNLETANLSKAKIKRAKFPKGYDLPADVDYD